MRRACVEILVYIILVFLCGISLWYFALVFPSETNKLALPGNNARLLRHILTVSANQIA